MIENGFWVFGYGSLIWNPQVKYSKKYVATLSDFSRSFCMWSIHHRGTQESPGLVLALDQMQGATCHGVAFFVEPDHAEKAIAELRERELISSAYLETTQKITLDTGVVVDAVCYIIDRNHVQYCKDLTLDEQAAIISRAVGDRGANTEYLFNTYSGIKALGLSDPDLDYLQTQVRGLAPKG